MELFEEYELIGRVLCDLKDGAATIKIERPCWDGTTSVEIEDVLPEYTNRVIDTLNVYWIDLRRQIREKLDIDEEGQTGLPEPAMVEQLVVDEAIPKNDYRRQQNSGG